MMAKLGMILAMVMLMASCSGAKFRPIVDMAGREKSNYEADLKECQDYAKEISPGESALAGAGASAVVGAIMGGIVGAFFGVPGRTAAMGAALGGVSGGARGAGGGVAVQMNIIRKCMQGRGWNVLN